MPAVAALLGALAAANARLRPLYDALAWLEKKGEQLTDLYNEFMAEETRRLWAWSKRCAGAGRAAALCQGWLGRARGAGPQLPCSR